MEPRSGTILAFHPSSWQPQGFPCSCAMAARKPCLSSHGDSREALCWCLHREENSPQHVSTSITCSQIQGGCSGGARTGAKGPSLL